MEAIIFVGAQASGKSTFYKERFFRTHLRLSLDMLRTRHREDVLLRACLEAKQPFVVDNTNPTAADRAKYVRLAKAAGFRVVADYFATSVAEALRRNAARAGKERVPEVAVRATLRKVEPPSPAEGFDAVYSVTIDEAGEFVVEEWSGGAP